MLAETYSTPMRAAIAHDLRAATPQELRALLAYCRRRPSGPGEAATLIDAELDRRGLLADAAAAHAIPSSSSPSAS